MSNLLFDERPLVVSPKLAVLLGDLDKAVILQQIHYWLERSTNLKDGYKWVYNSMAEWNKQFPWIAIATLKRKFKSLEDEKLLITGNYNKAKFDKTKWYRINYDVLNEMVQRSYQNDTTKVSKCDDEEYQNDTTNTIDYTENTTEITTREREETEETNIFDLLPSCGIYMNNINMQVLIQYTQKLSNDVLCYAAKYTSMQAQRPNFGYFRSILETLIANKVETVEQAEKALNRNPRSNKKPKPGFKQRTDINGIVF